MALKNGVTSLRSLEPRETFHPGIGPMQEACVLHVEQQRLVERALAKDEDFQLWDVGLGAAANALAAIQALRRGIPVSHPHKIIIHSFDKSTEPLEFALQNATALGYLLGYEDIIRELLTKGSVAIENNIVWKFQYGDFSRDISSGDFSRDIPNSALPSPDSIFYDPYSPIGNPEMWTLQNFINLRAKISDSRPCLLSNYTRSTSVRVSLLLAGFYVGIGCLIHEKDETTLASTHLDAIERPLDRKWLEKRVRISINAAPLRSVPYSTGPISNDDFEALLKLPQFSV